MGTQSANGEDEMNKINRTYFFYIVREHLYAGKMKQSEVDGCEAILDEWERRTEVKFIMPSYLAYMLATTYHETARTMQPIEEYGKGKNRSYGKIDPDTGHAYYGRGFVQLTWKENYKKAGDKLGIDLVHYPERALDLKIATDILFTGMIEGWFTGRKLSHYFNDHLIDYRQARKIINALDKADVIAKYAFYFREAIA